VSWSGPWIFQTTAPKRTPFPWVGERLSSYPVHPTRSETVSVRFDNSKTGALHIESGPCVLPDSCGLVDGFPDESYWLITTDLSHRALSRLHFWAAYGVVEMVPADLIDGPGDELLVIRTPAHASPSAGFFLEIWKLGAARPVELSDRIDVGTWISGLWMNWRANLLIDLTKPKPRSIEIRPEFGIYPCHLITSDERAQVRLRQVRALIFNPETRRYSPH
jgi:hypothetical protein